MNQRHTQKQDATSVTQSPLNIAIAKRDVQTFEMVAAAIKHKQTLLAYQPVMMSSDPRQVGFYEVLIRMMDAPGRIIPAKDFIHVIDDTELGRRIDSLSFNMGDAVPVQQAQLATLYQHVCAQYWIWPMEAKFLPLARVR